jgi:hypothetical protein
VDRLGGRYARFSCCQVACRSRAGLRHRPVFQSRARASQRGRRGVGGSTLAVDSGGACRARASALRSDACRLPRTAAGYPDLARQSPRAAGGATHRGGLGLLERGAGAGGTQAPTESLREALPLPSRSSSRSATSDAWIAARLKERPSSLGPTRSHQRATPFVPTRARRRWPPNRWWARLRRVTCCPSPRRDGSMPDDAAYFSARCPDVKVRRRRRRAPNRCCYRCSCRSIPRPHPSPRS